MRESLLTFSSPSGPGPFPLLSFIVCCCMFFFFFFPYPFRYPRSSASVQQVPCENCSIYRCILDVLKRKDEFHVLLFCHLDSFPLLHIFKRTFLSLLYCPLQVILIQGDKYTAWKTIQPQSQYFPSSPTPASPPSNGYAINSSYPSFFFSFLFPFLPPLSSLLSLSFLSTSWIIFTILFFFQYSICILWLSSLSI